MSKWTRTVTGDAKPRIKKNMQGLYWCSDKATHRSGWGKTVKEAYEQWQLMDSKRFEIARKGVWDRRSCMDWYRAGCPPISSYLGARQFVSYIPSTDTLILRGAA
jgi:hypothetical protein